MDKKHKEDLKSDSSDSKWTHFGQRPRVQISHKFAHFKENPVCSNCIDVRGCDDDDNGDCIFGSVSTKIQ